MANKNKATVQNTSADEIYFTISEAAQQVGVVQATIRNWEKQGLVKPKRTDCGYRVFSQSDIDLLKSIRQRSKEENIGISALQSIYGVVSAKRWRAEEKAKKDRFQSAKKDMAAKLRNCRIEKGMLVKDVAKAVGMSASYLSKIENAQANVSYKMILKLSAYYGRDFIGEIATPSAPKATVVRKGDGEYLSVSDDGITIEAVSGNHSLLSVMIYTVKPESGRMKPAPHKGEEFVHVIKGTVFFSIGDAKYMLKAGDSLGFRSEEDHMWFNCGSSVATLIWIHSPISL